MLGMMTVLSDSGISTGLSSIGGEVWNNKAKLSQLIYTSLRLRRLLALVSSISIVPLLVWLLNKNGSAFPNSILIAGAILLSFSFSITNGIYIVVPKLKSQLNKVQFSYIIDSVGRLFIIGIASILYLNTFIAIMAASFALSIQNLVLKRWVNTEIGIAKTTNYIFKQKIVSLVKHQFPSAIFYCIQGQIVILLLSAFGNNNSVAEVGALGRLAIVLTVINKIYGDIVMPKFSKAQGKANVLQMFLLTILFSFFISVALIAFSILFPEQILWILGSKYQGLTSELLLMVINTIVHFIGTTVWMLIAARGWVTNSWWSIPGTIFIQVILILTLDVSSISGALYFSIFSTIPIHLVNFYLTFRGFSRLTSNS